MLVVTMVKRGFRAFFIIEYSNTEYVEFGKNGHSRNSQKRSVFVKGDYKTPYFVGVSEPGNTEKVSPQNLPYCLIKGVDVHPLNVHLVDRNHYILNSQNHFKCNRNVIYRKINSLPEFIM